MRVLHQYLGMCKWTGRALLLGIVFLVCSFVFDWDYYEAIHEFLNEAGHFELYEILLLLGPISIGILIDVIHAKNLKKQEVRVYEQHLQTLDKTLHDAQDIINNFLNSTQLYILKAHDQKLDAADIEKLDTLIEQTTQRLSHLEEPLIQEKQAEQTQTVKR